MPWETASAKLLLEVIYSGEIETFVGIRAAVMQWMVLLQAGLQEGLLENMPVITVLL